MLVSIQQQRTLPRGDSRCQYVTLHKKYNRREPQHEPQKTLPPYHPLSRSIAQATLAVALGAAAIPQAQALSYELDNGVTVDWDTTLTYDAQWRMENRDPVLLDENQAVDPALGFVTDDGNRNFDKGDMIQNRISFGTDLDINYGDGGAFLRARGWYDDVYNDNSLQVDKNPLFAGLNKPYFKDGLDIHKSDIELLDAFLYHTFDVGERSLSLRAGRQVVSWGESLFIQGGISSAQVPLDATKANAPGVELKDIFLPVGQIYGQVDLTDTLSMGAYYQWEWEKTRIDAPGSYFNTLELLGQGVAGDSVPLFSGLGTTIQREKPDEGQYGIALRYLAEELNNTEFGLYALKFNDFLPTVQFVPATLFGPAGLGNDNVTLRHFEDIELYGMSFGTVVGDTNVSGEFNYRHGQPVRIGNPYGALYYSKADTLQTQLSAIHIFGQSRFWDNLVMTGEIANFRVLNLHDDDIASFLVAGNGTTLNDEQGAVHGDDSASSLVVRFAADYFSIASGLDMKVTATYRNDFDGDSPMLGGFNEGIEVLGLQADFSYLNQHSFGASYTAFLTDPADIVSDFNELQINHYNADRDYLALYYKYSF